MPDETFIITSSFVYVPWEAREREGMHMLAINTKGLEQQQLTAWQANTYTYTRG
jgi:hypothetical protein